MMKYEQNEQTKSEVDGKLVNSWVQGEVVCVQSLVGGQEIAVYPRIQDRVHSCSISLLIIWMMGNTAAKEPKKNYNEKKIQYSIFF